jgi:hypothetical protein
LGVGGEAGGGLGRGEGWKGQCSLMTAMNHDAER